MPVSDRIAGIQILSIPSQGSTKMLVIILTSILTCMAQEGMLWYGYSVKQKSDRGIRAAERP